MASQQQCSCKGLGGKDCPPECGKSQYVKKKRTGPRRKRPVPHNMGWNYLTDDSPAHQLKCGWYPGYIPCPVLKKIWRHRCMKSCGNCGSCSGCGSCGKCPRGASTSGRLCCPAPRCYEIYPLV